MQVAANILHVIITYLISFSVCFIYIIMYVSKLILVYIYKTKNDGASLSSYVYPSMIESNMANLLLPLRLFPLLLPPMTV